MQPTATAQGARSNLPIQGMTCANCARRLSRALESAQGVHSADVSFATQRAIVDYDPAQTSDSALRAVVEQTGYSVVQLSAAREGSAKPSPEDRALALRRAEEQQQRSLRQDLVFAAALTLPLLVLGMSHGAIAFAHSGVGRLAQLCLATPVIFGPGRRFMRAALSALRERATDMNTLVSLGALSAWGYSAAAVLTPELFPGGAAHAPPIYFEAGAAIITFVLLGRLLEGRARRRLSETLLGLSSLLPETTLRLRDGDAEEVPVASLRVGDRVLIQPGKRVPIDALIEEGAGAVDESMLTGESLPVEKRAGDPLFAGTLNQNGALTARATCGGEDTTLSRMVDAVEQAQSARAPIARLADVVSSYFVPTVIALSLTTFAAWLIADPSPNGFAQAVERMVAVLVIACPCALGLATPAAVAVGTGRAAALGVLFRGGASLEAASRIDRVLLDKTGTLTRGEPTLTDVKPTAGLTEAQLLSLVAAVEQQSEHPIARALCDGARARGIAIEPAQGFSSEPGGGVRAQVRGRDVRVGTPRWLAEQGVKAEALTAQLEALSREGRTAFLVAVDGEPAGLLGVSDPPREEAAAVVRELEAMGMSVAMVSGDRQSTAEAVALALGIRQVFAEARPSEKASLVRERVAAGEKVAMVGDGINDAPALVEAHLGVAVAQGSDIAFSAAGVALMRRSLSTLVTALKLARRTLRIIRQNLFWAFAYNVLGIPLAAGVLYPAYGFELSPMFASLAMSLSSVSVLANSLRLRRFVP